MKQLVINVVSFFVWLGLIFCVIFGYATGLQSGHEIAGALIGFLVGSLGCGFWFVLTEINDNLGILAKESLRMRDVATLKAFEDRIDTMTAGAKETIGETA